MTKTYRYKPGKKELPPLEVVQEHMERIKEARHWQQESKAGVKFYGDKLKEAITDAQENGVPGTFIAKYLGITKQAVWNITKD